MGLAASQARLLSLTARQHVVEGRAQYLQAQKLRLSNESDKVYNTYVSALDATALQTRTYDSKGEVHWLDGSLNNLLRYDAQEKDLGNVYYVQDINDGKLYMPEAIHNAYESSSEDLFRFLDTMNISYEKNAHKDEYLEALRMINSYKDLNYNYIPYTTEQLSKYNELKNNVLNPVKSETYNVADELSKLISYSKNSYSNVFYPSDEQQYTIMLNQLSKIKQTDYYTGDAKTIIDYCTSFNIPEIFDDTTNTVSLTVHNGEAAKTLYISYDKAKEEEKENPEEMQKIDNLMKFKMLLNGGNWKKNDSILVYDEFNMKPHKEIYETSGKIYNDDIQNTINNYTASINANIGEALCKMTDTIKKAEYDISKSNAENNLNAYLETINTTQPEIETKIQNYNKYLKAVEDLKTKDQTTYTKYEDSILGQYYEDIFNSIKAAGGSKPISTSNGKNATWVNNMIKNAQVVLASFDRNTQELDNVTASSNTGLREISNDEAITQADSEYETALNAISEKERKYDTKLKQLETERSAIKNEIDSLKTIAEDNINTTFKLFS